MISTSELTLSFSGRTLFENVSVKFVDGNCYGLIGANGAGKSTFLKILSGEIEQSSGLVIMEDGKTLSVLKQDQFAHEDFEVIDVVLMGNPALYKIYEERKVLYAKDEMTESEGLRVGDLEVEFGEMGGYTSEADASSMLADLGIAEDLHYKTMKELAPGEKIRVLLAQALFGDPDVLLLDEPTNQLDYASVLWLEKYLMDIKNTVIVVSHDRHFLNRVCTHTADLDYKEIKIYPGNYDFWKKSSELSAAQRLDKNKKIEGRVKELEDFVRRFSANASKSKQATSRKKLIEKLSPEELPVSSRRSPYISFTPVSKCGTDVVKVKQVSHTVEGELVLNNVSFTINKNEKVAIIGDNSITKTTLLQILAGEITPDKGEVEWGDSVQFTSFPKDNTKFFDTGATLLEWLTDFSETNEIQEVRGFLGRMLFSGDDVKKVVSVLSGGEKARAMFSKMMVTSANTLIFDEPTDHLDLESISSLNEGLSAYSECLIFTSHDYELLNTVANRIIEVSPKGHLDQRTSFSEYMESEIVAKKRLKLK
ncbi:ATP-binding cassette domain-containing protein [bacterium]|jgi:ATPase subunit of ABC transporter with duplicated ATPase domains|nr:ATP-binding cassette domain-containing protein [bacterium]